VQRLIRHNNYTLKNVDSTTIEDYLVHIADKRALVNVGLSDLCVDYSDVTHEQIAEIIRRYGVVCILNMIAPEELLFLAHSIENLCQHIMQRSKETNRKSGSIRNGVWQKEPVLASNMQAFCDYPKPIINIRGNTGLDTGMFDIFHIDNMNGFDTPEFKQCLALFGNPLIKAAIANNSSYRFSTQQVYRNLSVTDTRGFHIDNLVHTFKSFLYLTDVNSLQDGPYSYIPGSHKLPYIHRLELRLTEKMGANARDIWSSKYLTPVNFTAPMGSLILSDQTGIHRGLPQVDGALRIALVGNYNRHRLQ
jgi:hypothetical protein